MGGFSYNPILNNERYENTTYGLYVQTGFLEIYENGGQATVPGGMTTLSTDIWKVDYDGTNVKYYKNNSLIYTSSNPVTQPLHIFFALLTGYEGVTNVCVIGTPDSLPTPTATSTPTTTPTPSTTPNLVTSGLVIQLDAYDNSSYPGTGTTVYDIISGYNHTLIGATYTVLNGIKCFDCTTGNNRVDYNATGPTLPTSGYTYVTWTRLKTSTSVFRTLIYTKGSTKITPITIPNDTSTLGYWDTAFRSSGHDVSSSAGVWVQFAIVGTNSSQTFYINGSQVGSTIAFGNGGNAHWGWGNNDIVAQPWGHVANMYLYNRQLSLSEITQQYNYLAPRFVEPTPTPTNTVTPTNTPSITPTNSVTPTPSVTSSLTPTTTPTPSITPTTFVATQLLTNPEFSLGTTGWSATGGFGTWSYTLSNQVAVLNGVLYFTYVSRTISQSVNVSSFIGSANSFSGVINIKREENGPNNNDTYNFTLLFKNLAGTTIASKTTGSSVAPLNYTDVTLTLNRSEIPSTFNNINTVEVQLTGVDAGFWNGNHGPWVDYIRLNVS
jgi:hypothetical protein